MEIETAPADSPVDGQLTFNGSQGYRVCGSVRSLTETQIEFEVFGPSVPLGKNEVLKELRLGWGGRELSLNNVRIDCVLSNGPSLVCQASLEPDEFPPAAATAFHALMRGNKDRPVDQFKSMLGQWGRTQRIPSIFKEVVEDIRSFLAEMWKVLQRTEMTFGVAVSADGEKAALDSAAREYASIASVALDRLFSQFEEVSAQIDPVHAVAARNLCQTHWHPYLMTCPFMHRIYSKPLGYAGDYEMMNMIWRNQPEGRTLFAKFLSAYILNQGPAISVRNRVREVHRLLADEIIRVKSSGQTPAIFSVGCGPAREIELLMASPVSDATSYCLMDFNEETLAHARSSLEVVRRRHSRAASFEFSKRSVYQLMRENSRSQSQHEGFDVIYSSGLYDYLNDRVSRTVNSRLYEQLKPGGVLIVTNFDRSNPIRKMMEYAFEWYLIHRNSRQMEAMIPPEVAAEDCSIWADHTGINVFLEIRKPAVSQ